MNESIVAKTTITVPVNGGAVEAVSTIETVPYWTRSRKKSGKNFPHVLFIASYKHTCLTKQQDHTKQPMYAWNKWFGLVSFLCVLGFDLHVTLHVPAVAPSWIDTPTTDNSETVSEAPRTPVSEFPAQLQTPKTNEGGKKHHFISKTVRLNSWLKWIHCK